MCEIIGNFNISSEFRLKSIKTYYDSDPYYGLSQADLHHVVLDQIKEKYYVSASSVEEAVVTILHEHGSKVTKGRVKTNFCYDLRLTLREIELALGGI